MINLSILICHIPTRQKQLARLKAIIDAQTNPAVEVLVDAGTGHTGLKRNRLVGKSSGKYVAFVDDDDIVAYNYIDLVTAAIAGEPDCVGIVGIVRKNGCQDWTFRHSITVERWCKDKRNHIYFRTPNHLNPIKRDIVTQVMFNSGMTWGEDRDFSERIRGRLKTEVFVDDPIYIYLAR